MTELETRLIELLRSQNHELQRRETQLIQLLKQSNSERDKAIQQQRETIQRMERVELRYQDLASGWTKLEPLLDQFELLSKLIQSNGEKGGSTKGSSRPSPVMDSSPGYSP